MINKPLTLTLIVGKAAALSALLSGAALAQTPTVVDTPGAPAVVIPDAATTETPPQHIYPQIDRSANDETIAETLIAQGFTNVHILRDAAMLTVTAQRDGQPIELVYHLVRGQLLSVNGQPVPTETPVDATAGGQGSQAAADDSAPGTDTDTDEAADDASDDGAADTDAGAGADGSDSDTSDSSDSGGGDSDGGESDGADSDS
ncbi:MAG: hypothetical protein Q4G49_11065 [Paracoccus sp. (in: a-proteobacteria)]|nr:hypothetical protein [Paracoccus sp. (in: a-proteobacteria)]